MERQVTFIVSSISDIINGANKTNDEIVTELVNKVKMLMKLD